MRSAVPLGPAARDHLVAKKAREEATDGWLQQAEAHLRRAVEHFGSERDLRSIKVGDVKAFGAWLRALPNGRGGLLGRGAVRHHVNSLSNLFGALVETEVVAMNPVAAWKNKPRAERRESRWLEAHEVALLFEAARLAPAGRAVPFLYPLIAAFALTGGRVSDVLGLEVSDVSFDRRTVTFRPNGWRRLKTRQSARVVPLWPQLEEILRAYVFEAPPGRLLFPVFRGGIEYMAHDYRRALDAVAVRAGWKAGEIRSRMMRHSYTASRLQTLDGGEPVSTFTVSRELGHGGTSMVETIYAHLGTVRVRSAAVEYRVEQHAAKLGERLVALRSGTVCANLARKEAGASA